MSASRAAAVSAIHLGRSVQSNWTGTVESAHRSVLGDFDAHRYFAQPLFSVRCKLRFRDASLVAPIGGEVRLLRAVVFEQTVRTHCNRVLNDVGEMSIECPVTELQRP